MNTRGLFRSLALTACLVAMEVGAAQAPAGAPAGATGLCKDGTYYTGANKQGACRGHQGVKEWYGAPANGGKADAANSGKSDASKGGNANAANSGNANASNGKTNASSDATPAHAQSAPAATSKTGTATPAPGGGPGMVWLNANSNVYHCPGSRYYGTTKAGHYVTEAEAKAKGARPDHGKPCQ